MGLLDSIDPQILALLQGPTQDDAAAIRKHQMLTMGLAMMQHANMKPLQAIGYGGQVGLQAGADMQTQQAQQRQQRLAGFGQAMGLQNQLQQFQDQSDLRQKQLGFASQFGIPGAQPQQGPPPPAAPQSAPPQSLPQLNTSLSPDQLGIVQRDMMKTGLSQAQIPGGATGRQMVDITQLGGQPPPSAAPAASPPASPVPAKTQKYEAYQQMGDYWMQNSGGNPQALAQAQKYYDLAEKFRPKPVGEPRAVTMNGQRVMVQSYDSGPPQIQPFGPDADKPEVKDTGGALQGFDPRTLQPVGAPIPKTNSPDAAASLAETTRYHNLEMGIGPNGEQTNYDKVAQAIANYDQAPMSSFAMGKPIGAAIMSKVMEMNPAYDSKNFASAQQTLTAFSKGSEAQKVRSFNVALAHLDTLGQLTDALQNGNLPLVNKIGNVVSAQTGSPAVTNFTAAKAIVGNEIVKAIVGAGGGVEDRAKAQATLAAANSPAQLKGVIDTYKTLMGGQLSGLKQQYETGARRNDFDRFLSPEAQKYIKGASGGSDIRSAADKILAGQ